MGAESRIIIFSVIIFASVICWQFYSILGEKLNFPVNYRSHDDFCSILHTSRIAYLRVWHAFNSVMDWICGSYSMYVERTNKWIQTDQITIRLQVIFFRAVYQLSLTRWLAKGTWLQRSWQHMKVYERNNWDQRWRWWWFKILRQP